MIKIVSTVMISLKLAAADRCSHTYHNSWGSGHIIQKYFKEHVKEEWHPADERTQVDDNQTAKV